jgi:hypothetical protein
MEKLLRLLRSKCLLPTSRPEWQRSMGCGTLHPDGAHPEGRDSCRPRFLCPRGPAQIKCSHSPIAARLAL